MEGDYVTGIEMRVFGIHGGAIPTHALWFDITLHFIPYENRTNRVTEIEKENDNKSFVKCVSIDWHHTIF